MALSPRPDFYATAVNLSSPFTNAVIIGNVMSLFKSYASPEYSVVTTYGSGLVVVNNSMDALLPINSVATNGINIYNNVDLYGNPITTYNQIEPPNSIVRRTISGSSSATVQYSNKYIGVLPVSGGTTITLPSAVGYAGKEFIIADESGNAGFYPLTITPQAGQTINGASSTSISGGYLSKTLVSDGSNWFAR